MACICYKKLGEPEFDNIASKNDKIQNSKNNQLKLEVHDTYEKDEKLTTNFETVDNEDVINKAYLDENFKKLDGHISWIENENNEFKLEYNKQSVEEILIRRAVKTTV